MTALSQLTLPYFRTCHVTAGHVSKMAQPVDKQILFSRINLLIPTVSILIISCSSVSCVRDVSGLCKTLT